ARHPLDIDEIREHIDQGKLPTKLAMTWDDRVSFVLTEGLQLKKMAFLDVVMEGQSQEDGGFDADVAIATGEFSQLIPELIEALGGEGRTELGQLPDRGDVAQNAQKAALVAAKPASQSQVATPIKNVPDADFARRTAAGGAHTGPKQAPVDEDPATAPF
ncbi:MAG: recombination-associated protein RdgC, partial [Comamonas sp.]